MGEFSLLFLTQTKALPLWTLKLCKGGAQVRMFHPRKSMDPDDFLTSLEYFPVSNVLLSELCLIEGIQK